MKDYDFLRGDTINWYLLEAFFNDAGLEIPDKEELEKLFSKLKKLSGIHSVERYENETNL
jgi:hypothetical protein